MLAFGVLIGVVGVAGAKAASGPGAHPASGRSITAPGDGAGPGGVAGGGESGDPGGQSQSHGQSNVS